MAHLELHFQCGETSLSVRRFTIHEAISTPFSVSVMARSDNPAIDLSAIVGQPAGLRLTDRGSRAWQGICCTMAQTHAERREHEVQSQYTIRIVPHLWLLSERINHRIFQHLSIPDIVSRILDEWHIEATWRIDRGQHPKMEFRVQYGETDLDFVNRLLEEAGIAYLFDDSGAGASVLTFDDALHRGHERPPIAYDDNPLRAMGRELIQRLALAHDVRPGKVVLRDADFRRPDFELIGESPQAPGPERRYEQYHYIPGGMLVEAGAGGDTPVADDKGVARHDQPAGKARAARALEALRADRGGVLFECNVHGLRPGDVFRVEHHPHPDLGRKLLVSDTMVEGTAEGEWNLLGHAVFADVPFRPPLMTPRPHVHGVQSAMVVGPRDGTWLDQELHADEFGRIRVQFPWDRDGRRDDGSSCWIRVSDQWGGQGYGFMSLPRVGQEVLVTFLDGDPDRPVIFGRVPNTTQPVPYKQPQHSTVSAWKSDSSPGSSGFNELKFEDLKGEELFFLQAEKDRRRLVKHDELVTVGRHHSEMVNADRTTTVGEDHVRVTQKELRRMIGSTQQEHEAGDRRQLLRNDGTEHTEANRRLLVARDQDLVVQGEKRERDEWDHHARVLGDRKERVGKDASRMVYQEVHERVNGTFSREAGAELHVHAKEHVGEAPDITVAGPGGFLRIDGSGVVISGTTVDINVSGSPGHGHGSHPKEPKEAQEAQTETGVDYSVEDMKAQETVKALLDSLLKRGPKAVSDNVGSLDLMKLALTGDLCTPHDGLVLWSGGADEAGAVAQQIAEQRTAEGRPSLRIEMTQGGRALAGAAKNAPWDQASPAWKAASKRLARQASGDVTVIVSYSPVGQQAILRDELKMLAANKKVTSIQAHLMTPSPTGAYKDGAGNPYDLSPIDLKEVLAAPAKKP